MPFIGKMEVISSADTYVAADQTAAIALAVSSGPTDKATVIPRYPLWSSLTKYANDNGPFPTQVPQYIWDSTTTDGQVRAFAARSEMFFSGGDPVAISVCLTVFADNAHIARIDIYDFNVPSATLVETLTPPILVDGSMDANAGLTEVIPYNWQDLRVYSAQSSVLPGDGVYAVVVSFTVVNYLGFQPPMSPGNPAVLMFYSNIDICT